MKINERIYIKNTSRKGKTIFAKRNFKKNEKVFLVCGPIVTVPSIYTVPIDYGLFIDPLHLAGKELCHSCDPSCGIKKRNIVVAIRGIKKGEEVVIDYAMIVPKYSKEMTPKNRICRCGSKICRGKLGAYNELSNELKNKYKGFISEYLTSD